MEHKVRYRPTRTGSALVGLAIFLSASGLGLITESDAWIPSQPKPWRYKNYNNQNREAGYSGGSSSPQRGVKTHDPNMPERFRQAMDTKNSAVGEPSGKRLQDAAKQAIQAWDNRNSFDIPSGKPLAGQTTEGGSQPRFKMPHGSAIQDSGNTRTSLLYKGTPPLEAMKRGYKEDGLTRTMEKMYGQSPPPSELRAIVVEDYPDWIASPFK